MNTVCPLATCVDPQACSDRRCCILSLPPAERIALLAPPAYPYPLRCDQKPRATYPEGVKA